MDPDDSKPASVSDDSRRLCVQSRALQDISRRTVAQSRVVVQESINLALRLKKTGTKGCAAAERVASVSNAIESLEQDFES